MKYLNLTAQQALHFQEHGKILIVEKIEPQPNKVSDIGIPYRETLSWDLPDAPPEEIWMPIPCPFDRIGEIVGFREPWCEFMSDKRLWKLENVEYAADIYSADGNDWSNYTVELAEDMPDEYIRLFGKCVKSVADQNTWEQDQPWCWFTTFEKCEKGSA